MKRYSPVGFLAATLGLTLTASLSAETVTPRLLIEARDASPPSVLIAAHRGGYEDDHADKAPENSVANIRVSEAKGYPIYETDIQRTKDGHFVIVHDPTLDRETTGSGAASDHTLEELKRLRKKYRDGSPSEHRVATLEEFLSEGKGRTLFKADLKPGVSLHFDAIMKRVIESRRAPGIRRWFSHSTDEPGASNAGGVSSLKTTH